MKLPSHAYKVFDGVIFKVYHRDQEMYNGSIATFEGLKRPDTVDIIATSGDKIHIAKQSQPRKGEFYSIFGGQVNEGEDIQKAAKRELAEESGLVSDDWHYIRSYTPTNKMERDIHLFVARNCEFAGPQKLDPGEKIKLMTVNFQEFIEIMCYEDFYEKELVLDIFRIKDNPEKLDNFKKMLFG